jgi:hypothetical protein
MSNIKLHPYQQEIIDRLRAESPTARRIFDIPVIRSGIGFGADRVDERAGLLTDIKAVNDVTQADLSGLEQRVMQSAMFGTRYGKTWTGNISHTMVRTHFDNARRFTAANAEGLAFPPRKTLMYYHVQHALMSWSE